MNTQTFKNYIILIRNTGMEVGFIILFFLLPFTALAAPITKNFILDLTNKERMNENLNPLQENERLSQAAEKKAKDILDKQYFAHTNPDGKPFYAWIEDSGYHYLYAGENLAIDFSSAEAVIDGWLKSPTHRANILSDNYSEIGISVREGTFENHPAIIVVQTFGKPFVAIEKLKYYPSLEELTYNTLVKGAKEGKKKTQAPLNNITALATDTPITLNMENEIIPETSNLPQDNNATKIEISKIDENKTAMPSISYNSSNDDANFSGFNLLLIFSICIIIVSIYGSVLEKIKYSFNIALR
ncbi:MAG: CAP domain-containing protein [bacterium]